MSCLQSLHLQLRSAGSPAAFSAAPLSALPALRELRLDFDSPEPCFELLAPAGPAGDQEPRCHGLGALTLLSLSHAHPRSQMPASELLQTFREYCAARGLSHWQALVEGMPSY